MGREERGGVLQVGYTWSGVQESTGSVKMFEEHLCRDGRNLACRVESGPLHSLSLSFGFSPELPQD